MKGLLIKEMITNFKNNKFSLIIIPVFAVVGLLNKQSMFLMLIPMLLSMLPLGQMSYDEMSHWDKYIYCMPVNKKNYRILEIYLRSYNVRYFSCNYCCNDARR